MKYPQIAIENKIEGRVVVEFIINKNGEINSAKIARSIASSLDRLIR